MKSEMDVEEIQEMRNSLFLGLHELKELYEKTSISYRKKPEYLLKISCQQTKMRIAKMVELFRRVDPEFNSILERHLHTDGKIVSSYTESESIQEKVKE